MFKQVIKNLIVCDACGREAEAVEYVYNERGMIEVGVPNNWFTSKFNDKAHFCFDCYRVLAREHGVIM